MSLSERGPNTVAFIPFVVAGDPDQDTTLKMIDLLIEEGADLIELGVPFSDALADGPVIQFASEKAASTTSLDDVLKLVKRAREKHAGFRFVLFTYVNPILRMGEEEFAARASEAGVYAVLVVDLPPDESVVYRECMAKVNVKTVFLASPTTSLERFDPIARDSTAFVYYVSRAGVTGVQEKMSSTLSVEVKRLRERTDKPIAVGFGISNGGLAREVAQIADGVVVGSAFVKILEQGATLAALDQVRVLAREIRTATRNHS